MVLQLYVQRIEVGKQQYPLMLSYVQAGFPSPADDFIDCEIDLNDFLVINPAATFHVRVAGWSMRDAGIYSGDYVTIDRSLQASQGDIVLAIIDGEFTIKRLHQEKGSWYLMPENNSFESISVNEETEIIGVAIASFRKIKKGHEQSDSTC